MNNSFLFIIFLIVIKTEVSFAQNSDLNSILANAKVEFFSENYDQALISFNYCSQPNWSRKKEALLWKEKTIQLILLPKRVETALKKNNKGEAITLLDRMQKLNGSSKFVTQTKLKIESEIREASGKHLAESGKPTSPASEYIIIPPLPSKFELTYAEGIFAMRRCDYEAASRFFEKANQMRPGAIKTRQYFLKTDLLATYYNKLAEYAREQSKYSNEIIQIHESIVRLNKELELVQGNSSCIAAEKEYSDVLENILKRNLAGGNCSEAKLVKQKLELRDPENPILKLISICEKEAMADNCLEINRDLKQAVQNAKYLTIKGDPTASNSLIQLFYEKSKKNVKCSFDSLKTVAANLTIENNLLIAQKKCSEEQLSLYRMAQNHAERSAYRLAYKTYEQINLSCVNDDFVSNVENAKNQVFYYYKNEMMKMWEDSASYSNRITMWLDESRFLENAYGFHNTSSDSTRIVHKLFLNNCHQNFGKRCDTKLADFIAQKECNVDTSFFKGLKPEIIIGTGIGSIPGTIFEQYFSLPNYSGNSSSSVLLGLRFQKYNLAKRYDWRTSIFYAPSEVVSYSFTTDPNSVNFPYSFSFSSVTAQQDIKFHSKNCPANLKLIGGFGVNAVYNFSYVHLSPLDQYKDEIDNWVDNSLYGGWSAFVGIENPLLGAKKKNGISLELSYSRNGLILDRGRTKLKNPFETKSFNSQLALKLGVRIK